MKATINGITVEGTPQEIMEYQRLKAQGAQRKPQQPSKGWMTLGGLFGSVTLNGSDIKYKTY